jgi:SprT protein
MTLSIELKSTAQTSLENLFDHAISSPLLSGFSKTWSLPNLSYKQRGRIAGSALLQQNVIKLNPKLFVENIDYFLSHIIAHELAHILVYQLYGLSVKPHGNEWKKLMVEVFELAPKVTHTLDTSSAELQSFLYQCSCQQIPLSLIRHNKVQKGKQNYICRKCKESLILV